MRRLAVVVALFAAAAPANAQSAPASRSDSAHILHAAKSAQAVFESRRRFLAPQTTIGVSGACQQIGRFCRRPSAIAFKEIPEEPAGTTRARNELLKVLADAQLRIPGDGWIVGQRVRYLIEAGSDSDAAEIAGKCATERWWCDALVGLAAHSANRFVAAEQAFRRSLAEMARERRCDWTNLSKLLDGPALDAYRNLGCDERQTANRKIWWLADPLYSTPGNERRTEHFARETWAEIERGGSNGFGMSWGDDMRELIIRFGWAEKWTQQPQSGIGAGGPSYVAHEREPDFHFLSELPHTAPVAAFADSAWSIADDRAREGYSPRYLDAFVVIQPQIARFKRGDSTLIVSAFDVTGDTAWRYAAVRPALVIAPSDTSRFLLARFDSSARASALWITAPAVESLASVELLSLDGKTAGRWRGSVAPLQSDSSRNKISDILLFDATDSLAAGIDGAIATALGKSTIARDRRIGVYWETYGGAVPDTARAVSLTLTPIAPSAVTRLLRALGVGKKLTPVDVRWHDAGASADVQPKSVALDLSQVTEGRYELRLTVGEGPSASSASRVIVVHDRSALAIRQGRAASAFALHR